MSSVSNIIVWNYFIDVIRSQLLHLMHDGLKNEEFISINFDTKCKGVEIPDHLKDNYPDSMHIILQYEFKDLKCYRNYFSVTLSFSEKWEKITIPFRAITFLHNSVNDILLKKDNSKKLCNFYIHTPLIDKDIDDDQLNGIIDSLKNNQFENMYFSTLSELIMENLFDKYDNDVHQSNDDNNHNDTHHNNDDTQHNVKIIPFKKDDK